MLASCILRLRILYRDFNTKLGKTGAGLKYEDVTPGSDIHNLIGKFFDHVSLRHSACYKLC